jgi:hypothetical protein
MLRLATIVTLLAVGYAITIPTYGNCCNGTYLSAPIDKVDHCCQLYMTWHAEWVYSGILAPGGLSLYQCLRDLTLVSSGRTILMNFLEQYISADARSFDYISPNVYRTTSGSYSGMLLFSEYDGDWLEITSYQGGWGYVYIDRSNLHDCLVYPWTTMNFSRVGIGEAKTIHVEDAICIGNILSPTLIELRVVKLMSPMDSTTPANGESTSWFEVASSIFAVICILIAIVAIAFASLWVHQLCRARTASTALEKPQETETKSV